MNVEITQSRVKPNKEPLIISFSQLMEYRTYRTVLIAGSTYLGIIAADQFIQGLPDAANFLAYSAIFALPVLERIRRLRS